MTNDALIERLADLEHQQWMHWAQALIADEPGLAPERIARWRQDLIPYRDLPTTRQELDRVWARRVLTLLQKDDLP